MVDTSDRVVRAALATVIQDYGWRAAATSERLRAALSDVLGPDADVYRGLLDNLVVSAEEGIPAGLRGLAPDQVDPARRDAVARLTAWGMSVATAAWIVEAWVSLLPTPTLGDQPTEPATPADAGPADAAPSDVDSVVAGPGVLGSTVADSVMPTLLPEAVGRLAPTRLPDPPAPVTEVPSAEPGSARVHRWRRRLIVIVTSVVALVAVGGGYAVAKHGDSTAGGTSPSSSPGSSSSAAGPSQAPSQAWWVLQSADSMTPTAPSTRLAMVGSAGGVQVTGLQRLRMLDDHGHAIDPAQAGVAIAFALRSLQGETARHPVKLAALDLVVAGGSTPQPITTAARSGTYVITVPEGATPQLEYDADGVRQTLSLLDGSPGAANIEVLARPTLTGTLGAGQSSVHLDATVVQEPAVMRGCASDVVVDAHTAKLLYFTPKSVIHRVPAHDHTYVYVDLDAQYPACAQRNARWQGSFYVAPSLLTLRLRPAGTSCPAVPLSSDPARPEVVFDCPATISRAVLDIGGTETLMLGSDSVQITVPRHAIDITFP